MEDVFLWTRIPLTNFRHFFSSVIYITEVFILSKDTWLLFLIVVRPALANFSKVGLRLPEDVPPLTLLLLRFFTELGPVATACAQNRCLSLVDCGWLLCICEEDKAWGAWLREHTDTQMRTSSERTSRLADGRWRYLNFREVMTSMVPTRHSNCNLSILAS